MFVKRLSFFPECTFETGLCFQFGTDVGRLVIHSTVLWLSSQPDVRRSSCGEGCPFFVFIIPYLFLYLCISFGEAERMMPLWPDTCWFLKPLALFMWWRHCISTIFYIQIVVMFHCFRQFVWLSVFHDSFVINHQPKNHLPSVKENSENNGQQL